MSSGSQSAPLTHSSPADASPPTRLLKSQPPPLIPTFSTLLVLSFDVSLLSHARSSQVTAKQTRSEAEGSVRVGWKLVKDSLVGSGLKVTCRPAQGKEYVGKEVWVFVGAEDRKVSELSEKERQNDFLHSVTSSIPFSATAPSEGLSEGDRIRLVYEYLTSAVIQGGLGITPGEGVWSRVIAITPLHDEQVNHDWIQSWLGRHWYIGLLFGSDDGDKIRAHFGPDIAIYFSFLSFYTLSLLPLTLFGIVFWLGSKGAYAKTLAAMGLTGLAGSRGPSGEGYGWEWSWVYGLGVGVWGVAVTEIWAIQQRKLAVKYGTHRVSRVDRLRPQYIATLPGTDGSPSSIPPALALSPTQDTTFLQREARIVASVPVIAACGFGLGLVLTGVFLFEAFLMHLYDGFGKSLLGLVPTALFIGVIPNIIALYHTLTLKLTNWENHPTKRSYENSLTVKTFAMNAIVAYLGLFLSAYVYVPFGDLIMSHFTTMFHRQSWFKAAATPEQAGLGPALSIASKTHIKSDRLVNQVFAYTVTNQVVGSFTELGLPYVKRFIARWRAGEDTNKGKPTGHESSRFASGTASDEQKFLQKVGYELGLAEYSLFGDYAEMVTQFGYICAWSIVWPLGPLGALINNYFELRSDAAKICSHARRPVGNRVESIGPWLNTMSFITWLAFVTNSTLVYLFKPSLDLPATEQSINPNLATDGFASYGSSFLYDALDHASQSPANKTLAQSSYVLPSWLAASSVLKSVLPMVIPSLFVALLASHLFFAVKVGFRYFAEHVLWWGSAEQLGLEKGEEFLKKQYLNDVLSRRTAPSVQASQGRLPRMESTWGTVEKVSYGETTFWQGGLQAGNEEIQRVFKTA